MRWAKAAISAAGVLVICAQTAPQDPSPIARNFRAYNEALARGDLADAESAADAALTASEARDGDGGSTAVLAFNLARVRVLLGQYEAAGAPAQRAYDLRSRGGVDAVMAELMWGRVRLGIEGFRASDFLTQALQRAAAREDLLGDRYDAAEQLGLWAMQTNNHLIARRAWSLAADAARGAQYDANYAHGRARAYEAMSIALQSFTRDILMSPTAAREVRERLREAYPLVRPFAFTATGDGGVTQPQQLYAQILAWDAIVWAKMATDNSSQRSEDRLDANPTSMDGTPVCFVHGLDRGGLYYPVQSVNEGQLGAVIVRLSFDEAGAYQRADIAAAVGHESLERNVRQAAADWSFATEVVDGCRIAQIQYLPIVYYMR